MQKKSKLQCYYDEGNDLLNRWVFRDRQNDFVELEDFKLLGRLFHNLGPLTLNIFNPNDFSLCLLGTTSFDLADLTFCNWNGVTCQIRRNLVGQALIHLQSDFKFNSFINFQPVKLLEYRGNVIIFSYSCNEPGCCIDYGLNTLRCYLR